MFEKKNSNDTPNNKNVKNQTDFTDQRPVSMDDLFDKLNNIQIDFQNSSNSQKDFSSQNDFGNSLSFLDSDFLSSEFLEPIEPKVSSKDTEYSAVNNSEINLNLTTEVCIACSGEGFRRTHVNGYDSKLPCYFCSASGKISRGSYQPPKQSYLLDKHSKLEEE